LKLRTLFYAVQARCWANFRFYLHANSITHICNNAGLRPTCFAFILIEFYIAFALALSQQISGCNAFDIKSAPHTQLFPQLDPRSWNYVCRD